MFTKTPTQLDGALTSAAASAAPAESAPSKSPQKKEEAPPKENVKEFKVNGKVVKIDLNNQVEVDKLLQLGLASGDKFQEAAKMRKEAEEILSAAKTEKSAAKALKKAGFSDAEVKEILEKELAGFYEEEALSPEEKQRRTEMEELRRYKEEEARKKEDEAKSAKDKEIEAEMVQLEEELLGALSKSKLPRTPVLAKWAVQYMSAYDAQGINLTADQAVKIVEQEFPQLISAVLSSTKDVQQLKQLLGKDVVKKLLDDSVAAVKKAEQPFAKEKQVSREASGSNQKPKQKESMNNYFEKLRRGEI